MHYSPHMPMHYSSHMPMHYSSHMPMHYSSQAAAAAAILDHSNMHRRCEAELLPCMTAGLPILRLRKVLILLEQLRSSQARAVTSSIHTLCMGKLKRRAVMQAGLLQTWEDGMQAWGNGMQAWGDGMQAYLPTPFATLMPAGPPDDPLDDLPDPPADPAPMAQSSEAWLSLGNDTLLACWNTPTERERLSRDLNQSSISRVGSRPTFANASELVVQYHDAAQAIIPCSATYTSPA